MNKEPIWKREDRSLNEDAEQNVQLKKQISKETGKDSLIQHSINEKIYDLKSEATTLTKKLENEKHKCLELETIISHMKLLMESERRAEASETSEINFESVESLERKIVKFEYDLDQLNSKTNKLSSVVADKRNKISTLRTERTIDSGIFRNIEKELIQSELDFKKLLIEKIKHEKAYAQTLTEYSTLRSRAQQYFSAQESAKRETLNEDSADEGAESEGMKMKFQEIKHGVSQYRQPAFSQESQNSEKNSYYEFLIKKFLLGLDLNSTQEFFNLQNSLEETNDKNYQLLNKVSDESNDNEAEIRQLEEQLNSKAIQFYKPRPELTKIQRQYINCKKLKEEFKECEAFSLGQNDEIRAFMQSATLSSLTEDFDLKKELLNSENQKQTVENEGNEPNSQTGSQKSSENLRSAEAVNAEDVMSLFQELEKKLGFLECHAPPLRDSEESSNQRTARTDKKEEKLDDLMNRVKVFEESDKIMHRHEFQEEYKQLLQAGVHSNNRAFTKKKTKKAV